VERAGPGGVVELDALGRHVPVGTREHDVAARDEQVPVAEDLDPIGEELALAAGQRQLDVAGQDAAFPLTLEPPRRLPFEERRELEGRRVRRLRGRPSDGEQAHDARQKENAIHRRVGVIGE
jgi:hypothetical protein